MPNRGFEVELEFALHNLMTGVMLDETELQVINCATEDELRETFDKINSRLLYTEEIQDVERVKNFKINLNLINTVKNGQAVILDKESSSRLLVPLNKEEFKAKYSGDYYTELDKALHNLIIGLMLTESQIQVISAASNIELHDAFQLVYKKRLDGIDEDLGETFDLCMFILKSLQLSDGILIQGNNITNITRAQYEAKMTEHFNKNL